MLRQLRIVAGALAIGLPALGSAQGTGMMKAPAAKDVTVQGTVIDVSCKFGQGLTGKDHRMCAQICGDRGLPLAILTDEGKLYIPASAGMPGDGQNGRLKEFAEQRVKISGKAFAAGGATAIQISSIVPVQ